MKNIIAAQDDTAAVKMDLQLFADEPAPEPAPTEPVAEPTPVVEPTATDPAPVVYGTDPKAEPTPTEPEPPQGAPEEYAEFTMPEGFEKLEEFNDFAKGQNWTQEQAQQAIDFYTSTVVPKMQAMHEKQVEQWGEQSKKEFGDKGIEAANKALGRFVTPELKEFLQNTGLGNHPEMIRCFKTIGEKISESTLVQTQTSTTPKSLGEIFYPNMKK